MNQIEVLYIRAEAALPTGDIYVAQSESLASYPEHVLNAVRQMAVDQVVHEAGVRTEDVTVSEYRMMIDIDEEEG